MDKLNEWFKPFESIKRLNFEEAKGLLKKARESENETLKQQLYNEVILGTMYIIYDYIKNNKLYNVVTQDFDLDDLTSSFTRQWVTIIKTVDFKQFSSFEQVLTNYRFKYKSLTGIINDQSSDMGDRMSLPTSGKIFTQEQIRDFFKDYVSAVKLKGECTISDLGYDNDYRFNQYDDSLVALIEIFDDLYFNYWDPKRYEKGVLAPEDYKVINARLRMKSMETVSIFDQDIEDEPSIIDEEIDKMFNEKIIGDALKILTARERAIVKKFFGLGNERKMGTYEIATEFRLTHQRINQILKKAIVKIKFYLINHSQRAYNYNDLISQGLISVNDIYDLESRRLLTHKEAYIAERLFFLKGPMADMYIQFELDITKAEYDRMFQNIMRVLQEQRFSRYNLENYTPPKASSSRN